MTMKHRTSCILQEEKGAPSSSCLAELLVEIDFCFPEYIVYR